LNEKYQKWLFCQYAKQDCENYLFEDYYWKSGIPIGIHALWTRKEERR